MVSVFLKVNYQLVTRLGNLMILSRHAVRCLCAFATRCVDPTSSQSKGLFLDVIINELRLAAKQAVLWTVRVDVRSVNADLVREEH